MAERQVLAWLQPGRPERFRPEVFPVFNLEVEEGRFYGFPSFLVPGFKFGKYHHRGERVDPDRFNREPEPEDEELLRGFARRYFPDGAGPTLMLKTCLFTNSPTATSFSTCIPSTRKYPSPPGSPATVTSFVAWWGK